MANPMTGSQATKLSKSEINQASKLCNACLLERTLNYKIKY